MPSTFRLVEGKLLATKYYRNFNCNEKRPFAQWLHAAYQNTLPDHSWIKLDVYIQVLFFSSDDSPSFSNEKIQNNELDTMTDGLTVSMVGLGYQEKLRNFLDLHWLLLLGTSLAADGGKLQAHAHEEPTWLDGMAVPRDQGDKCRFTWTQTYAAFDSFEVLWRATSARGFGKAPAV